MWQNMTLKFRMKIYCHSDWKNDVIYYSEMSSSWNFCYKIVRVHSSKFHTVIDHCTIVRTFQNDVCPVWTKKAAIIVQQTKWLTKLWFIFPNYFVQNNFFTKWLRSLDKTRVVSGYFKIFQTYYAHVEHKKPNI